MEKVQRKQRHGSKSRLPDWKSQKWDLKKEISAIMFHVRKYKYIESINIYIEYINIRPQGNTESWRRKKLRVNLKAKV